MSQMRLQLFLAKAGLASRRHAEELITSGQVTVNGQRITQLGSQVDSAKDQVAVQGRRVQAEPAVYILLNKPKGYVTTASDPEERHTVYSLLEPSEEAPADKNTREDAFARSAGPKIPKVRLFSVGRLDYNTEGALILTNDGLLANRLMHPRYGVEKLYHAKFKGHLTKQQVQALRTGVELPKARDFSQVELKPTARRKQAQVKPQPERSSPAEVRVLATTSMHTWLELIIHEGKNRQIHRMAEAIGSTLLKLARIQYAFLSVTDMAVGTFRKLQPDEIENLYQLVGLDRSIGHVPELSPARPHRKKPLSQAQPVFRKKDLPMRSLGGKRGSNSVRLTRGEEQIEPQPSTQRVLQRRTKPRSLKEQTIEARPTRRTGGTTKRSQPNRPRAATKKTQA